MSHDEFIGYKLVQDEVAEKFYHLEYEQQFTEFLHHVIASAADTMALWRSQVPGEKTEEFVRLYKEDLMEEIELFRQDIDHGNHLEYDDQLAQYSDRRIERSRISRIDYYMINSTERRDYKQVLETHPTAIYDRKKELLLLVAIKMKVNEANLKTLQSGVGDYTRLNWRATYQ
jgi:hypothetical protein